jgi:hypothetical protein
MIAESFPMTTVKPTQQESVSRREHGLSVIPSELVRALGY